MSVRKILLVNGPNLDMLGVREPEVYGTDTLESLEASVRAYAAQKGVEITCFQSNSESDLIDRIHTSMNEFDAVVYNPAAHTHYSYALRDAVAAINIPVVEVHLSDVSEREEFRKISVIAPVCVAQVKGLGIEGYHRAIDLLCDGKGYERLGEGYAQAGAGQAIVTGREIEAEPDAPGDAPDTFESFDLNEIMDGIHSELGVNAGFVSDASAGQLSRERQDYVSAACERLGIGALLVRDTSNIQWITAFDGVFDEERAHGLLVANGRAHLHTDSRYSNAMRTVAQRIDSDVAIDDERVSHAVFARNVMANVGLLDSGVRLGIEDTITYAEFVKMVDCFTPSGLAPTTEIVLGLRAVKDQGEIARLKAAQAVTDAAFTHIIGFMRPGMTEREVQLELEDYMVRHGGDGLAFRSIVAAGANGADPHAVPGQTRLEAGQCVVMDFGAKRAGYCSDMTRTVFLGLPEGDMARAWETLRRANEEVEAMLKPGVTGAQAHQLAEDVLEQGGFGGAMGHGLGHGVGIDVHELPVLNPRNDKPLVEGNVVTVEPGIYLPGRFGMRLEDFGVITAHGFEVFTQSTHEMVVI